ncbi:MAG: hypothetical protein WD846_04045 [Patescibacteria group bacterium]
MHLTDEDIDGFRRIYKKRFGEDISREEAREEGSSLLRLMKVVYKPVTQEQVDSLRERDMKRVDEAYDFIFAKALKEKKSESNADD